jgi:hypothetical protein
MTKTIVHINRNIPPFAWNIFKTLSPYQGLFLPIIVHDFEFEKNSNWFYGQFVHLEHGTLSSIPNFDVLFTHSERNDPLTVGIIVWNNHKFDNNCNYPTNTTMVKTEDDGAYGYYLCSELHEDCIATLLSALQTVVTYIKVEPLERIIGEHTFEGYHELQCVDLGNVEVVEHSAFYKCKKLHKLRGRKALRILNDYCFSGCALEYVLLGFNIECHLLLASVKMFCV